MQGGISRNISPVAQLATEKIPMSGGNSFEAASIWTSRKNRRWIFHFQNPALKKNKNKSRNKKTEAWGGNVKISFPSRDGEDQALSAEMEVGLQGEEIIRSQAAC